MGIFTYLKSFLKDKDVASVAPSSKFIIEQVCEPIDFSRDNLIVEYGAGTGVFAKYLLYESTPGSRLLLFETNDGFFQKLRTIEDPRVQSFHESVERVTERLGDYRGRVDYIISGIPFSFLKKEVKRDILEQSKEMLRPGGLFLAYQTTGHLKKPLREVFGNVETSVEVRNIPPMTVYRAEKR